MENKSREEKSSKQFVKTRLKPVTPSALTPNITFPSTIEEHNAVGHSRNSRKMHYFQGSRD
jgi:hypothetical protein